MSKTRQAVEIRPTSNKSPLAEQLLYIAVCTSPFAQAFTIPAGFPLKISEICGLLAIALLFTEQRKGWHKASGGHLIALFAALLAASTALGVARPIPSINPAGYEHGLLFDIVLYAGYGGFVVAMCWMLARYLGPERIGQGVGIAIRLTAAYSVFQVMAYLAGAGGVVTATQGSLQLGRSYGIMLTRSGPLLEGNYLGFTAGVALFVCAHRRDRVGAWLSVACLVYSQSTSGMLAAVAAALVIMLVRPHARLIGAAAAVGIGLLVIGPMIPTVEQAATVQLAKFGLADAGHWSGAQALTTSRDMRTASSTAGFMLGAMNPFLGVGPGRYGAWNNSVVDSRGQLVNWVNPKHRPIANNGLSQIAAEEGLVALLVIIVLLVRLVFRMRNHGRAMLGLAVFCLAGFNTAPAWTLMAAWIAIAHMISTDSRDHAEGHAVPLASPPRQHHLAARR